MIAAVEAAELTRHCDTDDKDTQAGRNHASLVERRSKSPTRHTRR